MRARLALLIIVSASAVGCEPPPSVNVSERNHPPVDAAVRDAPVATADAPPVPADAMSGPPDAGTGDAQVQPPPPAVDPFVDQRASCTFGKGARVIDTLPLSESARAAIPIKHVIVMMKENRSFDHLLGNLHASGQLDAEAIPASFTNNDKDGMPVAPFPLDTTCVNHDPGHQWYEMHRQVNGGAMDGFVVNGADTTGGDGHFVMGNYADADVPFYYWLAGTFALNDRHFPSVRSGTWPNRSFLMLGTADGVVCTFCGRVPKPTTPSIFDSLDRAGVNWGAYSDSDPFDGTFGWNQSHRGIHSFAAFQKALKDGTLPAVAFVDGIGWVEDEHPTADVQVGENWTRLVYEAVVASPLWPSTALVWTYDEAGGFSDHVPPPNAACVARPGNPDDVGFTELGVRVPLAVISPYARPHYVSHVVQDHTSITRLIEAVFDLPALTARDANSTALLDMFDFENAPALLHPPKAPLAGSGGCHGDLVLVSDEPSYVSQSPFTLHLGFRGGATPPHDHDRIGVYRYPRVPADIPTEANPIEPIAWSFIGDHGQTPNGAPISGEVDIDEADVTPGSAWPLAPGLWIAYYLTAQPSGETGHTVASEALLEVTP